MMTAIATDDGDIAKPYAVYVGNVAEWEQAGLILQTANRKTAFNYCKRAAAKHTFATVRTFEGGVILSYINHKKLI